MAKGRIDQEIAIKVTGVDDAKAADQLVSDLGRKKTTKVTVDVDADTKAATRDIDGLMDKVDKLGADAGTILLTSNATTIAAEIADLISDLDRLDADDANVDITVANINQLQGDLDQVEAKLREINQTDVSPSVDSGGFTKIVDGADQANSATANMAGNVTQDMAQIAGVTGSAGTAMGQLGEYFVDSAFKAKEAGQGFGAIFKSFAGAVGPIAALGAGIAVISQVMEARAASAEAAAAQTEALTAAYTKGGDAARNYATALNEAGEIEVELGRNKTAEEVGGLVGLWGKLAPLVTNAAEAMGLFGQATGDLAPTLAKAGVSTEQWAAAVVGGNQAFGTFATALSHTTLSADEQARALDALTQAQQSNGEAKRNAASFETVFGGAVTETSQHVADLDQAYADAASSSTAYADAQAAAAEAVQRVNDVLTAQADALNAQVDAAVAAADSQLAANDAYAAFGQILTDDKASADDVTDAAIDLAKATVQLKDDQAAANGTTQTATGRLDAQNQALLNTAAAASGPARSGILDYIGTVNQIPPEKLTEIQAAIDAGDLATATRLLNEASATRITAIQATATNVAATDSTLNNLARDRTMLITPRVGQVAYRADGGVAPAGGAIGGEAGPELVRYPNGRRALLTAPTMLPPGAMVTSTKRTRSILTRRRGGASAVPSAIAVSVPVAMQPVTINVNAAVVGSRYDVAKAVGQGARDLRRLIGTRGVNA